MNGLSVVVPTYARFLELERLLVSLQADRMRCDFPVEIILVDDTPGEQGEKIVSLARRFGAELFRESYSVGEKRNLGARNAQFDMLLFLDSDVVIRPGTLASHMRELRAGSSQTAGCLGLVEFVGRRNFPFKVIDAMQLSLPFAYAKVTDKVVWGPTANLSFRKDVFLAFDGFNKSFPAFGGEDVDLGLRLAREGYYFVTAADAVAEHTVETWNTWGQNLRRLFWYGVGDYYLLESHPERVYVDFPSLLVIIVVQALCSVGLMLSRPSVSEKSMCIALSAPILSMLAYQVIYALFKKKLSREAWGIHFFGPIIFLTMDTAKSLYALINMRPDLIFKRVRFMDDLIIRDWGEIVASAWGLTMSVFAYIGLIMFC